MARKHKPEPFECFKNRGYCPVNIGDVFNQSYRAVQPVGWGLNSTVWQVEDLQTQDQKAIKLLISELSGDDVGWDEAVILKTLRDRNPRADGYPYICHLHEDFSLQGPNGPHICLVTELMGAAVLDIVFCLPNLTLPLWLVKRISKHVLLALQYMHECGMVHTDITGDHIMMSSIPFPPILPEEVIVNRDNFESTVFKLGGMGSTHLLTSRFAPPIQQARLRCPEVILDGKWDTKADIWNFGCLMYEFARGGRLFDPEWKIEESGLTSYENHLEQMVGLLGEFPRALLDRSPDANQFFDTQGELLKGTGKYRRTIQALLQKAGHSPDDLLPMADFLSRALVIDPVERWSATQLLQHPWLEGVN